MRNISINTAGINDLKASVEGFNDLAEGELTKEFKTFLEGIADSLKATLKTNFEAVETAKKVVSDDTSKLAAKLLGAATPNSDQEAALLRLRDYLTKNLNKADVSSMKAAFQGDNNVLALITQFPVSESVKLSDRFGNLPKTFSREDLLNRGDMLISFPQEMSDEDKNSRLDSLASFLAIRANENKKFSDLATELQSLFNIGTTNAPTQVNDYFKANDLQSSQSKKNDLTSALNTFSDKVESSLDSANVNDKTSLEAQAKLWFEGPGSNNLKQALEDVQKKVEEFSKEINAFDANLDKTFGAKKSDKNVDSKSIRELIMLMLIFSTLEASDWDAAQAETDTSRYEITDDG
jgi:hypothetical protein